MISTGAEFRNHPQYHGHGIPWKNEAQQGRREQFSNVDEMSSWIFYHKNNPVMWKLNNGAM